MTVEQKSQYMMLIAICLTALIFLSSSVSFFSPGPNVPIPTNISLANITSTSVSEREHYFMVFIIPTMADHAKIRTAIRASWMNVTRWQALQGEEYEPYRRIKVMFVVADIRDKEHSPEFLAEMEEYGDIFLVSGIEEHRLVLKYKVMWGMSQSIALFNYDYVIKTDDDIMVNLPYLTEILKGSKRTGFYTGRCAMVYGGFRGFPRWPYCSGGGYILSRDVVERIMRLPAKVHRVPFRPEDGYTGWLIYSLGETEEGPVKPTKNQHMFTYKMPEEPPYNYCFYHGIRAAKFEQNFEKIDSVPLAPFNWTKHAERNRVEESSQPES